MCPGCFTLPHPRDERRASVVKRGFVGTSLIGLEWTLHTQQSSLGRLFVKHLFLLYTRCSHTHVSEFYCNLVHTFRDTVSIIVVLVFLPDELTLNMSAPFRGKLSLTFLSFFLSSTHIPVLILDESLLGTTVSGQVILVEPTLALKHVLAF